MQANPLHVLSAASRHVPSAGAQVSETLLIAGATGALGNAVVQALVGSQQFVGTTVLAREPIKTGMRGVMACVVPTARAPSAGHDEQGDAPSTLEHWPVLNATTGVILFDPPRMYYQRERALWTPTPAQLPALARWMRGCGVLTLAVVMPHVQGQLPGALKRGLANLDEQSVAALGFERLLIVRSAEKPGAGGVKRSWPARAAHGVLAAMSYMVPSSEQPVRASKVAELVDVALRSMSPGTHVAAPELVWRAAQGHLPSVVGEWLHKPSAEPLSGAKSKHLLHEATTR